MTFNLKKLPVGLLLLIGLFIIWVWSAKKPQGRKAHENTLEKKEDPYFEFKDGRFLTMMEDQVFSIIAVKYGLSPETVKNVLSDYEKASDLLDEGPPIFPQAKNTQEVIIAISDKYGLDAKTIASMLIDENALNQCPNGYDGPEDYSSAD